MCFDTQEKLNLSPYLEEGAMGFYCHFQQYSQVILWLSVLLVKETSVPRENLRLDYIIRQ
jgi:hypothetical protein